MNNSERIDVILVLLREIRDSLYLLRFPLTVTVPDAEPFLPTTCSLCGLDLSKMTNYVCSQTACPSGLSGPTFGRSGQ